MRNVKIKKGFFQGFYYLTDNDNNVMYAILHNATEKNWNKWSVYRGQGEHNGEYNDDNPIGIFETLNESVEWLIKEIGADGPIDRE